MLFLDNINCCIIFSTADWSESYWTNKQHTARQFTLKDYRVLYIESVGLRTPNLKSTRDWNRIWRRLKTGLHSAKQVENNIWVISPLVLPFMHKNPLVRIFNQGLLRFTIKRFLQKNNFKCPTIWTYHPYMLDTITGIEHGKLVYHCVDDLSAVPGVDVLSFKQEELRLLNAANVVFTTSPALMEMCSEQNKNTYYFSNVVDKEHFNLALNDGPLPNELQKIPEPRLGYVGVLSDFKIDFQLLVDVANNHPEWNFVFIGEEREGQNSPYIHQLKAMQNAHFLGYRSYQVLPDYLRGFNVALLPTLINDYTKSMFPMKYFEYLAAGLRIVSTPLDFTRHNKAGMETGKDSKNFEHAIQKQLGRSKLTMPESDSYVGDNTWSARMEKMLDLMDGS